MLNKKGNALLSVMVAAIIVGLLITSFYLITSPKFAAKDKVTVEGTDVIITDKGFDTGIPDGTDKYHAYTLQVEDGKSGLTTNYVVVNSKGTIVNKVDNKYNFIKGNTYTAIIVEDTTEISKNRGAEFTVPMEVRDVIKVRVPAPYTINVKNEFGNVIPRFSVFDHKSHEIFARVDGKYNLHANEYYTITSDGMMSSKAGPIITSDDVLDITLYSRFVEIELVPYIGLNKVKNPEDYHFTVCNYKTDEVIKPNYSKNKDGERVAYYLLNFNETYYARLDGHKNNIFTISKNTITRSQLKLDFTANEKVGFKIVFQNMDPSEKLKAVNYNSNADVTYYTTASPDGQTTIYNFTLEADQKYIFSTVIPAEKVNTISPKIPIEYVALKSDASNQVVKKFEFETRNYVISSNINPVKIYDGYDPNGVNTPLVPVKDEFTFIPNKEYTAIDPFGKVLNFKAPIDNNVVYIKFPYSELLQYRIHSDTPVKAVYYVPKDSQNNLDEANKSLLSKNGFTNTYGLLRSANYIFEDIYGKQTCISDFNTRKETKIHEIPYSYKSHDINLQFKDSTNYTLTSNLSPVNLKYRIPGVNGAPEQEFDIPDLSPTTKDGVYNLKGDQTYYLTNSYDSQGIPFIPNQLPETGTQAAKDKVISLKKNGKKKIITANYKDFKDYEIRSNVKPFQVFYNYDVNKVEIFQSVNSNSVNFKFSLKPGFVYEIKNTYGQSIEVIPDKNLDYIDAVFPLDNLDFKTYNVKLQDITGKTLDQDLKFDTIMHNGQTIEPFQAPKDPTKNHYYTYQLLPGEIYVARCTKTYNNPSSVTNGKRIYFDTEFIVPYYDGNGPKDIVVKMEKIPFYELTPIDQLGIGKANPRDRSIINSTHYINSTNTNLNSHNDIISMQGLIQKDIIKINNVDFVNRIEEFISGEFLRIDKHERIKYYLQKVTYENGILNIDFEVNELYFGRWYERTLNSQIRMSFKSTKDNGSNDIAQNITLEVKHDLDPYGTNSIIVKEIPPIYFGDCHQNVCKQVADMVAYSINEKIYNTVIKAK